MKKIIMLLIAVPLLAISTVHAQTKLTDEQKSELRDRFKEYKEKLNLTPDQEPKVSAIDSTYLAGLAALKSSSSGRFAKFRQFKSLSGTRDSQMKDVLTKDQYKEYQKFKSEMRGEMKEIKNHKQ